MKIHEMWLGDSVELCQKFKPGRVNCIITDPPFGVDNQSNMAKTEAGKKHATKIKNDESPEVALKLFNEVMDVLLPKTADDCDLYVFTAYQVLKEWLSALDELGARHGFERKAVLVWEKDGPGMGDLDSWGQGHEFIIFLKKGRVPIHSKRRNGVIHFPQLRPNKLIHPHEKPEGLLEILIKHSTQPGEFIVDPFGGSGSLVRAARNAGRNAVAIELDPERFEKSKKKLEEQEGSLWDE
ncbi:DNA methyltransferase [Gordonia phage Demosthenes]|uniref:DNA methylase n=7 Tax=Demosthenesvirus TaxID=1982106 RepID=A0A345MCH4_9CAUD|nr:DNA methyltransferase [Gordonia phage Kvothe]YP_009276753.1 DNA methyltransferase [Gordonia phage Demosthenes]YP_009603316.1 DNA methyltransferase [Gordonia phage Katyusha]AMS03752.1 DNA methylase [Gordonia phage Benczkowski14]AXH68195.1 DNA methylase [Gordonia phage Teatealatte]QBP29601.1 DNA methylase [Gordonia phage Tredge]QFG08530.1 DNA methylase [Gordonia phage ASerpRocky]UJD20680.1 DNA methylase [Gordonia phage Niagara]